jgi:hypothetical protein
MMTESNESQDSVLASTPSELREDIAPEGGIIHPVFMDKRMVAEQWRINRVFGMLIFVTVACLAALVLSPIPAVQVAVVTIWSGAAALSRYLLSSAYRNRNRE